MKHIKLGKRLELLIKFHRYVLAFPIAFNFCKFFFGFWILFWSFELWFNKSAGTEIKQIPIEDAVKESLKVQQDFIIIQQEIAKALIIPKSLIFNLIKSKRTATEINERKKNDQNTIH